MPDLPNCGDRYKHFRVEHAVSGAVGTCVRTLYEHYRYIVWADGSRSWEEPSVAR